MHISRKRSTSPVAHSQQRRAPQRSAAQQQRRSAAQRCLWRGDPEPALGSRAGAGTPSRRRDPGPAPGSRAGAGILSRARPGPGSRAGAGILSRASPGRAGIGGEGGRPAPPCAEWLVLLDRNWIQVNSSESNSDRTGTVILHREPRVSHFRVISEPVGICANGLLLLDRNWFRRSQIRSSRSSPFAQMNYFFVYRHKKDHFRGNDMHICNGTPEDDIVTNHTTRLQKVTWVVIHHPTLE